MQLSIFELRHSINTKMQNPYEMHFMQKQVFKIYLKMIILNALSLMVILLYI